MSYYVYILYSKSLHRFYKGQTDDLSERLNYHNSGFETSTSKGVPWVLLWAGKKGTRAEAIKFETKLKNLTRKRLLQLMLKYSEEIVSEDAFETIIRLIKKEGSSQ
jgi:putative endonuclease